MTLVRQTADAYLGIEGASEGQWQQWHEAMLHERARVLASAGLGAGDYVDPATDWSDRTFRQFFLFMYDTSFYDRGSGRYRTKALIDRWRRAFGGIDSVLLWQGYPRLGFDERTQFDFYRDMPGGLTRLRADVVDVLHASGIRVFVDYNPWAEGGYDELAEIVARLDADGVMLDTMTDAPDRLAHAIGLRKKGVVLAPELRPRDADLSRHRQAWAQWSEVGDGSAPSMLRHRWLVPRHRQFAIRRWDRSRRHDIVYSFFNGSGLLLWDNVFGTWNPYSRADRRLIAETGAVLERYGDLFAHGTWEPLVPTGQRGLDAHRWSDGERSIVTLRNRTASPLRYEPRSHVSSGQSCLAFWGARHPLGSGDGVIVEPNGTEALVVDRTSALEEARALFDRSSRGADVDLGNDVPTPPPRIVTVPRRISPADGAAAPMVMLPGGTFTMRIRHERRECGCYPFGATDDAMWGWHYEDIVEHAAVMRIERFAMRSIAVTNAEYLAFVHASGYRPDDGEHFLRHLVVKGRASDLGLPLALDDERGRAPVTFVSLADARAYADWHRQRLPSEAEWQWAAEGAGLGHHYPWGDDERAFASRPSRDVRTATPQGIMGLSGDAWELTESEHEDGHTRFVMLRGGIYLPPGESEWLVARGPRPNDSHAKYILASDGLDRSATITFRTVVDA